jgi:hypothetical protein
MRALAEQSQDMVRVVRAPSPARHGVCVERMPLKVHSVTPLATSHKQTVPPTSENSFFSLEHRDEVPTGQPRTDVIQSPI